MRKSTDTLSALSMPFTIWACTCSEYHFCAWFRRKHVQDGFNIKEMWKTISSKRSRFSHSIKTMAKKSQFPKVSIHFLRIMSLDNSPSLSMSDSQLGWRLRLVDYLHAHRHQWSQISISGVACGGGYGYLRMSRISRKISRFRTISSEY